MVAPALPQVMAWYLLQLLLVPLAKTVRRKTGSMAEMEDRLIMGLEGLVETHPLPMEEPPHLLVVAAAVLAPIQELGPVVLAHAAKL